jgi:hypothetical protein
MKPLTSWVNEEANSFFRAFQHWKARLPGNGGGIASRISEYCGGVIARLGRPILIGDSDRQILKQGPAVAAFFPTVTRPNSTISMPFAPGRSLDSREPDRDTELAREILRGYSSGSHGGLNWECRSTSEVSWLFTS